VRGPGLAATLRGARRARGVDVAAVAGAIGYANRAKGSRRIHAWERGEALPEMRQLGALARALGLEEGVLSALRDAECDAAEAPQREAAVARTRDREVLRRELGSLLAHRADILSNHHLSSSRPACAELALLWCGGVRPTLGGLLRAWGEGRLQHPCACGGVVHLYRAVGSPLSGRCVLEGVCCQCRQLASSQRAAEGVSLAGLVGRALSRPDPLLEGAPLALVPSLLAGGGASSRGLGPCGDELLRYDHRAGRLYHRGVVVAGHFSGVHRVVDASPAGSASWWEETTLGAARSGAPGEGEVPGLQRGRQWVLWAEEPGRRRAVLGLRGLVLNVRGRGEALRLDHAVPRAALAAWARGEGVLDVS